MERGVLFSCSGPEQEMLGLQTLGHGCATQREQLEQGMMEQNTREVGSRKFRLTRAGGT